MTIPQTIGRYEIKGELGRGGMATVYHGYDPRFKRDVAIKVLPPQYLHDPTFLARFEREAQTIATLEHPAIVPVYDFGEEAGQPYLVMRYMAGGSLAGRLARRPLAIAEVAVLLRRIGPALDELHDRGIIHRDLKPGNILYDHRGDAYLSDFGIAKVTESPTPLTTGGMTMGTVEYMSPEQAEGLADIDGRSDIYALGAMVFHLLTGRPPYQAETISGMLVAHMTKPVPRILEVKPDLPPACEEIITRAMAKDRRLRYERAGDLVAAFSAMAGEPISPAPEMPVPPLPESSAETPPAEAAPPPKKELPATRVAPPPPERKGGWLGSVKQGLDKFRPVGTTPPPAAPPPPGEPVAPLPYHLAGPHSAALPEELPAASELAWEPAFQGFKDGKIQQWLESWERFYQATGQAERQQACQVYLAGSANLRRQLRFKETTVQQALFEEFLQCLGAAPPPVTVQPERVELGEILFLDSGHGEIELRHPGPRGLVSGQVTAEAPWLQVGNASTLAKLVALWPGSKGYPFYLRPGQALRIPLVAATEGLPSGAHTGQVLVKTKDGREHIVTVTLSVNIEAVLRDPARHQAPGASDTICRKVLKVEPENRRARFMLARALTDLGLQLLERMPRQVLTYAQEAQALLEMSIQAGIEQEIDPEELAGVKKRLASLWVELSKMAGLGHT